MAEAVFALCALASLGCAALLARGYVKRRSRLLLWSAVCFAALAVNNVLLFADLVLVPGIDLGILRSATALAGTGVLIYGLIWDAS